MRDRPNLLLITTDQHRGDCLGIAKHPVVETPHLDAWFGRGACFVRAYSEVPSTTSARRTVISGQRPERHGMVGYKDGVPFDVAHTLPGELARAGYQTQFVGNMHMHPHRKLFGFHHKILHEGPRGVPGYVDDYNAWLAQTPWGAVGERAHGLDSNSWVARPFHLPEGCQTTNWTVSMAIHFLDRRDPTQPFFLWISFVKPHAPLDPPDPYFRPYLDMDLPEPPIGDWAHVHRVAPEGPDVNAWRAVLSPRVIHRAQAAYYGLITHIDHQLSRLFQHLRNLGLWDHTFALMTSDHGEMLGDHHLYRKSYAYEGSARVPFLIRYARGMEDLESHKVVDQAVGLEDVMPTFLDAAGVEIPDTVEGRSVLSLLREQAAAWRPYLHGEHASCYAPGNAMQYLTDGKEKYIWFPVTGQEQLFDLVEDPQECRDLARVPEAEDRVAKWRDRLVRELEGRSDGLSDGQRLILQEGPTSPLLPPLADATA